jgi:FtsH-binding integral membrane protein
MEQFKLIEDGYGQLRKVHLKKVFLFLLVMISSMLLFWYIATNGRHNEYSTFPSFLALILVFGGSLLCYTFLLVKRNEKIYHSYRLTFDNSTIKREQYNTPTIDILKEDVSEIYKNSKGYYTIKGNRTADTIFVTPQIEEYERIGNLLGDIKPIVTKNSEIHQKSNRILLIVLCITIAIPIIFQNSNFSIIISRLVFMGVIGYNLYEISRSKNINNSTKREMLIAMVAGLMAMSANIYQNLS